MTIFDFEVQAKILALIKARLSKAKEMQKMPIKFSHPKPDAYAENYHVIADVLKLGDYLKLNRGVEVGVRHGFFSKHLLEQFPKLSMALVDSYPEYHDNGTDMTKEVQEEIKNRAAILLLPFDWRARWYYMSSEEASTKVTGLFDFVFIDAEHTYAAAKTDLYAWRLRVRDGGLLCGHDFSMTGVQQAVTEFAAQYNLEIKHVAGTADVWLMEVKHI